jgi:hypothetical protein
MYFSIVLITLLEIAQDDVNHTIKRRSKEESEKASQEDGGVLASSTLPSLDVAALEKELSLQIFEKLWSANRSWAKKALDDAVSYARTNEPRDQKTILRVLNPDAWKVKSEQESNANEHFAKAWQSLKNRGWKAQIITSGEQSGKTRYEFDGVQVRLDDASSLSYLILLTLHLIMCTSFGLTSPS